MSRPGTPKAHDGDLLRTSSLVSCETPVQYSESDSQVQTTSKGILYDCKSYMKHDNVFI